MIIKPKYVSFEQAKLLKEKGFDIPTYKLFSSDGLEMNVGSELDCAGNDNKYKNNSLNGWISRPEQWQVVEWLFQKYSYSIEAELNIPESGENNGCYVFNGVVKGSLDYTLRIFYKSEDYPTKEKAYSAAFDYILKALT